MKTTYIGQTKLIVYKGRYYSEEAADHVVQAEWADKVLDEPAVTYPNGRNSHEVAGDVIDAAEDGLIDFLRVLAHSL